MAPAPAQAPAKKGGVDFKHPGGKEFLIAGGVALGLALLYFWWKGRQQQQQGQGQGQGGGKAGSPTAVFSAWLQDHAGTGAGGGGNGDGGHPGRGQVAVPNVVGLTDTAADAAITAVGLKVGDTNEPKGGFGHTATVESQAPSAGTRVKHGSEVHLTFNQRKTSKTHGGSGDSGEA